MVFKIGDEDDNENPEEEQPNKDQFIEEEHKEQVAEQEYEEEYDDEVAVALSSYRGHTYQRSDMLESR